MIYKSIDEVKSLLEKYEEFYNATINIFNTIHPTIHLEEVDVPHLSDDGKEIEFGYDDGLEWSTGKFPLEYYTMTKDEYCKDHWDKEEAWVTKLKEEIAKAEEIRKKEEEKREYQKYLELKEKYEEKPTSGTNSAETANKCCKNCGNSHWVLDGAGDDVDYFCKRNGSTHWINNKHTECCPNFIWRR